MGLYVKLLGPVELRSADDRPATPQTLKLRSLLAALCLHADRTVSTSGLIHALWSGAPPRTATAALQVYVSKLRKHLAAVGAGPAVLTTVAPGYRLSLAGHGLDLREFDDLTAQARAAREVGRLHLAQELMVLAGTLWSGPALADLRTVPALDAAAREVDQRRFAAHEERFDLELRLGRHRAVLGELFGLVAEHPTWEPIHAHLMIALYRSGRVADALRVYRALRQALIGDLGMEPSARLQRLHRAVLAREPWLDPDRLQSRAG